MTRSSSTRLPFDSDWYARTYADVANARRAGRVSSLEEHYLSHGAAEGRLPHAPVDGGRRVFAYGSFGSNNAGDEAILEGVRKLFPKVVPFVLNKSRDGSGYFPHVALQRRDFFQRDDLLIIGGGGLLYDRPTVALMADLAEAAKGAGAFVDILRLGCEAAQDSYRDEILRLYSFARHATVRSSSSQRTMEALLGETLPVEADFAFALTRELDTVPQQVGAVPTIGLVTASMHETEVRLFADLVRRWTRKRREFPIRFVHLPHSRSYFNDDNNDVLLGERLWIASEMQHAHDESLLEMRTFECDPRRLLRSYKQLDGVVSMRYHGLVFGKVARLPTLAVGERGPKVGGFLEDHASELLLGTTLEGLSQSFERFVEVVMRTRSTRLERRQASIHDTEPSR